MDIEEVSQSEKRVDSLSNDDGNHIEIEPTNVLVDSIIIQDGRTCGVCFKPFFQNSILKCLSDSTKQPSLAATCTKCELFCHLGCYGLESEDELNEDGVLEFECDFCKDHEDLDEKECAVCGLNDGVLKKLNQSNQNEFIHVLCGLINDEIYVDTTTLSFTLLTKSQQSAKERVLRKKTFKSEKKCLICSNPGANLGCRSGGCNNYFHFQCYLSTSKRLIPTKTEKDKIIKFENIIGFKSNFEDCLVEWFGSSSIKDNDKLFSQLVQTIGEQGFTNPKSRFCGECPEHESKFFYCSCEKGGELDPMIGCDYCDNWFHFDCTGMTKEDADALDSYFCKGCLDITNFRNLLTDDYLKGEKNQFSEFRVNFIERTKIFPITTLPKTLQILDFICVFRYIDQSFIHLLNKTSEMDLEIPLRTKIDSFPFNFSSGYTKYIVKIEAEKIVKTSLESSLQEYTEKAFDENKMFQLDFEQCNEFISSFNLLQGLNLKNNVSTELLIMIKCKICLEVKGLDSKEFLILINDFEKLDQNLIQHQLIYQDFLNFKNKFVPVYFELQDEIKDAMINGEKLNKDFVEKYREFSEESGILIQKIEKDLKTISGLESYSSKKKKLCFEESKKIFEDYEDIIIEFKLTDQALNVKKALLDYNELEKITDLQSMKMKLKSIHSLYRNSWKGTLKPFQQKFQNAERVQNKIQKILSSLIKLEEVPLYNSILKEYLESNLSFDEGNVLELTIEVLKYFTETKNKIPLVRVEYLFDKISFKTNSSNFPFQIQEFQEKSEKLKKQIYEIQNSAFNGISDEDILKTITDLIDEFDSIFDGIPQNLTLLYESIKNFISIKNLIPSEFGKEMHKKIQEISIWTSFGEIILNNELCIGNDLLYKNIKTILHFQSLKYNLTHPNYLSICQIIDDFNTDVEHFIEYKKMEINERFIESFEENIKLSMSSWFEMEEELELIGILKNFIPNYKEIKEAFKLNRELKDLYESNFQNTDASNYKAIYKIIQSTVSDGMRIHFPYLNQFHEEYESTKSSRAEIIGLLENQKNPIKVSTLLRLKKECQNYSWLSTIIIKLEEMINLFYHEVLPIANFIYSKEISLTAEILKSISKFLLKSKISSQFLIEEANGLIISLLLLSVNKYNLDIWKKALKVLNYCNIDELKSSKYKIQTIIKTYNSSINSIDLIKSSNEKLHKDKFEEIINQLKNSRINYQVDITLENSLENYNKIQKLLNSNDVKITQTDFEDLKELDSNCIIKTGFEEILKKKFDLIEYAREILSEKVIKYEKLQDLCRQYDSSFVEINDYRKEIEDLLENANNIINKLENENLGFDEANHLDEELHNLNIEFSKDKEEYYCHLIWKAKSLAIQNGKTISYKQFENLLIEGDNKNYDTENLLKLMNLIRKEVEELGPEEIEAKGSKVCSQFDVSDEIIEYKIEKGENSSAKLSIGNITLKKMKNNEKPKNVKKSETVENSTNKNVTQRDRQRFEKELNQIFEENSAFKYIEDLQSHVSMIERQIYGTSNGSTSNYEKIGSKYLHLFEELKKFIFTSKILAKKKFHIQILEKLVGKVEFLSKFEEKNKALFFSKDKEITEKLPKKDEKLKDKLGDISKSEDFKNKKIKLEEKHDNFPTKAVITQNKPFSLSQAMNDISDNKNEKPKTPEPKKSNPFESLFSKNPIQGQIEKKSNSIPLIKAVRQKSNNSKSEQPYDPFSSVIPQIPDDNSSEGKFSKIERKDSLESIGKDKGFEKKFGIHGSVASLSSLEDISKNKSEKVILYDPDNDNLDIEDENANQGSISYITKV